jgi:hypothetical protein
MVVYDTQIYCGYGLCPSTRIRNQSTAFRKLDLSPSSGERRRRLLCCVPRRELTSISDFRLLNVVRSVELHFTGG